MAEVTVTAASKTQQCSNTRQRILAIVGASSGNLVEWFDFYVYSFGSLYFAAAFFPSGDSTTQLLQTAGVFAAGFLMRPIGGYIFGRIADRRDRRTSMLISVLLMCGCSFLIACLPTYDTLGHWASALLLLTRLFQGLSVGGEYGSSATYMSEVAEPDRRGFYASFQYVTLIGGQLLALLTIVVLQQWLEPAALAAWGWRIPFFMGGILAIISLFLRRVLSETARQEQRQSNAAGTLLGLWRCRRAVLVVFGFTAAGSLSFYTFTTYMQKYLVNSVGMETATASTVMTVALVIFMLVQPLFGYLSDCIGRRSSMILFGGLAALFTVPLLTLLQRVTTPYAALGIILCALLIVSFYTSISGVLKAEMFPSEVRALGVGFSYAVGNALFGGSAEYLALLLKSVGMETAFFWYVAGMCLMAMLVAFRLQRKDVRIDL